MAQADPRDQRLLLLLPTGRDGPAAAQLFGKAGLQPLLCRDLPAFAAALREGAGAGLIAEEAFGRDSALAGALFDWVAGQPPWSDFPFVVLTRGGHSDGRSVGQQGGHDSARRELVQSLRNVTLLERPAQVVTLLAATQAALRSRARQYDARDYLLERVLAAQRLEELVQERTRQFEQANDRLREQIAEREQAEAALRQAQKMEAVGQLTGGIAHDFNNLLTGIVGSLELLQKRLAAGRIDGAERYVAGAMGAASRAGALTNRLLSFARRQALDPKPTDVNALVTSMADLMRRTLGETIELRTALAPGLWSIDCDANQLENALLNLVINARDAMPDGGRLSIGTGNQRLPARPHLPAGDYVRLAVADSGVGMPAELMEKVFEPFFTTKPIGQGTGLGLSMLYGFVKQSHGHVQIDSEVGRGTEVTILMPRGLDTGAERDGGPPAALDTAPKADCGETVLVVEDEGIIRLLMLEVLEGLGYAALEAEDGRAAMRIVESGVRIDLLVTDVGLPGLNGRQLAEMARQHRPGLPVLFVTGYAHHASDGRDYLEPGMHLVHKPFTMSALAAKVRAIIGGVAAAPVAR